MAALTVVEWVGLKAYWMVVVKGRKSEFLWAVGKVSHRAISTAVTMGAMSALIAAYWMVA